MKFSNRKIYLLAFLLQLVAESNSETNGRNPYLGLPVQGGPAPKYVIKQRNLYANMPTSLESPDIKEYHPLEAFPLLFKKKFVVTADYFRTLFSMTNDIFPIIPHEVKKSFMRQLSLYLNSKEEPMGKLMSTITQDESPVIIARWFDLLEYSSPDKIDAFLSPLPLKEYLLALSHVDVNLFSFPSLIHLLRAIHSLRNKGDDYYEEVQSKLMSAVSLYVPNANDQAHFIDPETKCPRNNLTGGANYDNLYKNNPILNYYPEFVIRNEGNYYANNIELTLKVGSSKMAEKLMDQNVVIYDLTMKPTPHGLSVMCKQSPMDFIALSSDIRKNEGLMARILERLQGLPANCLKADHQVLRAAGSQNYAGEIYSQTRRILNQKKRDPQNSTFQSCPTSMIQLSFGQSSAYSTFSEWKDIFCTKLSQCSALDPATVIWNIAEKTFLNGNETRDNLCKEENVKRIQAESAIKRTILRRDAKVKTKLFAHPLQILNISRSNYMLADASLPALRKLFYYTKLFSNLRDHPNKIEVYYYLEHLFQIMPTNNALDTLLRKHMIIDAMKMKKPLTKKNSIIKGINALKSKKKEIISPLQSATPLESKKNKKQAYESQVLNLQGISKKNLISAIESIDALTALKAFPTSGLSVKMQTAYLNEVFKKEESFEYIQKWFREGNYEIIQELLGDFAQQGPDFENMTHFILTASLNFIANLRNKKGVADSVRPPIHHALDETVTKLLKENFKGMDDQLIAYLVAYLN